ncbi:MAG: FSR family fosmidomycin resistance protein-like MFS transporter [Candidatus Promineifilaceae bacterium]|jgi:FSR family fosmidomycin resistance protein-like MFS transporter
MTNLQEPIENERPSIDGDEFQLEHVATVAGAHFVHDTYTGFLPVLLPIIRDNLAISNSLAGSLIVWSQAPSLLNPFIGYIADRISVRYFIILAPAITGTLMSLLGLANSYVAMAMILFATGLSIAGFHAPAPALIGRVAGKNTGRGMSIFMAGGELGRTLGPLIIAFTVQRMGFGGVWGLSIVGWIVSGVLYYRLKNLSIKPATKAQVPFKTLWPQAQNYFLILFWLMGFRALLIMSMTVWLPTFMQDVIGASVTISSWSLSIVEAAGVVGALFAGTLSDRVGRRPMLMGLLLVAPLLGLAFVNSSGWVSIVLMILIGITVISPTPVIMASVQDQFPDNRAFANGVMLAINFVTRGIAIWGVGFLADRIGFESAFYWSCLIALLSLPATFLLPLGNKKEIKTG